MTMRSEAREILEKHFGVKVHRFTEKGGHETGYAQDNNIDLAISELIKLIEGCSTVEEVLSKLKE